MTSETGYYVRVQRDGKWQALDIAELSDDEIDQLHATTSMDGWAWVKVLVKWIRTNMRERNAAAVAAVRAGRVSLNAARELAGLPPGQEDIDRAGRHARWVLVDDGWPVVVIRDIGPWDEHPTVTNDAEYVVTELLRSRQLRPGQRLFYYDSDGRRDELLIKDGKFAGFAPGTSAR